MAAGTYTASELVTLTGVPVRTLRHWVNRKVVPKPIGRGRGARYDERHLLCVRVAQHLRKSGSSLRAIRPRIAGASDAELRALLPPAPRPTTPEGLPVPPAPPSYPFVSWEVIGLVDGLILMVNPAKGPLLRRIADDIYRHYGAARSDGGT